MSDKREYEGDEALEQARRAVEPIVSAEARGSGEVGIGVCTKCKRDYVFCICHSRVSKPAERELTDAEWRKVYRVWVDAYFRRQLTWLTFLYCLALLFDNKTLILTGSFITICGFIFLYKVWWKISFDLPRHPNFPIYVSMVIVCMALAGLGLMVIAHGIGWL